MTTLIEAKQILYSALVTDWGSETPYILDNRGTLDSNGVDLTATKLPWIRATIKHETFSQFTQGPVGGRKFERKGRLLVQIFTLGNKGTETSDLLSQKIVLAMEGKTFTGVCIDNVTPRELGQDGKWYQVLADIEFTYQEIK